VEVVLPDYGGVPLESESLVDLGVPGWAGPARARRGTHPQAGQVTLVDAPELARPHPYLQPDGHAWPDNERRFLAFSRAVAALVVELSPDVLHLNDWHTSAVLAALRDPPPSVLSIHNLAYQGTCEGEWLERLGPRSGAFAWNGDCNPLAGAIALADAIVAVSPTYAAEIQRPESGCGLDRLLRERSDALVGIRNGIDTAVWDPATDPHLGEHYDAGRLETKQRLRAALRAELGLPDGRAPLVIMVTRLTHQKGIDLVPPLVPDLERLPAQLAVLGAGEVDLARGLAEAAADRPETMVFVEGYDEGLGHRLFGAGDLLLMPSRFEPCGLTQMQAMRYGTIPVVTDVGGLHDTVRDADAVRRAGTGFVADAAEASAVRAALERAVRGWASIRRRRALQRRGMSADWSWREPAARHVELYRRVGLPADASG
jgi:starch synthase